MRSSTLHFVFHTQGGFSVLTLLAFGDEKYYICIEIWEEPRLPPFFVTFPLKSGFLGALPGKICLPLIFLCLPQILIRGRQRKIARRVGKIGRRKVFSEVKNVNVESLKNGSKLLVFWRNFSTKRIREEESKSQRVKKSKGQRDKETKSQRDKESKRGRDERP